MKIFLPNESIPLNGNILSNENIISNENYFYRVKIFFLSNENIFYRMEIYILLTKNILSSKKIFFFIECKYIFIEFSYISATIHTEITLFILLKRSCEPMSPL